MLSGFDFVGSDLNREAGKPARIAMCLYVSAGEPVKIAAFCICMSAVDVRPWLFGDDRTTVYEWAQVERLLAISVERGSLPDIRFA